MIICRKNAPKGRNNYASASVLVITEKPSEKIYSSAPAIIQLFIYQNTTAMNLTDLLKLSLGEKIADSAQPTADNALAAASPTADYDVSVYIPGTSSELYDSHHCLDLGVWSDLFDAD
jgi:hypothetical protein